MKGFYSLSGWTENFGVVPLFLFSAFLLRPALFTLLALLFFVTRVLETISTLQDNSESKIHKGRLLYHLILFVKVFLAFSPQAYATNNNQETIILSVGEHAEIPFKSLKKFSIGNKDVIGENLNAKGKILLIKGKKIGHTEILLWEIGNIRKRYFIYVLPKSTQLQFASASQIFKEMNLKSEFIGKALIVEGEIDSLDNYRLFHQTLTEKLKEFIHERVYLTPTAKRDLLGEIYAHFFDENLRNFYCEATHLSINCHYSEYYPPSNALKKFLERNYYVKLYQRRRKNLPINYLLQIKLFQIKKASYDDNSLGFYGLQGKLEDIFNAHYKKFLNENEIFFSNNNTHFAELSSSQILITQDTPVLIKKGTETPFVSHQEKNFAKTDWKFSGLKIKVNLKKREDHFFLDYQIGLSEGNDDDKISGGEEKSSIKVELNSPIQLFQINIKTTQEDHRGLPFIKNFLSSKKENFQIIDILGIVQIKEVENGK